MREFRTLRSMSGERKRSDGPQSEPQATAPLLDSTTTSIAPVREHQHTNDPAFVKATSQARIAS